MFDLVDPGQDLQLADRTARCVVISAAETPEQVARAVRHQMITFLAEREKRRQRV